jgi:hypothetical protein
MSLVDQVVHRVSALLFWKGRTRGRGYLRMSFQARSSMGNCFLGLDTTASTIARFEWRIEMSSRMGGRPRGTKWGQKLQLLLWRWFRVLAIQTRHISGMSGPNGQ